MGNILIKMTVHCLTAEKGKNLLNDVIEVKYKYSNEIFFVDVAICDNKVCQNCSYNGQNPRPGRLLGVD